MDRRHGRSVARAERDRPAAVVGTRAGRRRRVVPKTPETDEDEEVIAKPGFHKAPGAPQTVGPAPDTGRSRHAECKCSRLTSQPNRRCGRKVVRNQWSNAGEKRHSSSPSTRGSGCSRACRLDSVRRKRSSATLCSSSAGHAHRSRLKRRHEGPTDAAEEPQMGASGDGCPRPRLNPSSCPPALRATALATKQSVRDARMLLTNGAM